jgi:hypothetical protein
VLPKFKGVVKLCKVVLFLRSNLAERVALWDDKICFGQGQPVGDVLLHLFTLQVLHVDNDKFVCFENVQELNDVWSTN